jgi:hypothetical protein
MARFVQPWCWCVYVSSYWKCGNRHRIKPACIAPKIWLRSNIHPVVIILAFLYSLMLFIPSNLCGKINVLYEKCQIHVCPRHQDFRGNGGIRISVLNFDTRLGQWSMPFRRTSGERSLVLHWIKGYVGPRIPFEDF